MATDEAVFCHSGRDSVVAVCATDKAVLERIHAETLLECDAKLETFANKVALVENAVRIFLDGVGVLKISKLVRGPELSVHFRIALDLHHFDQRFEVLTSLCVVNTDRIAGRVIVRKHHQFAGV